MAAWPNSRRQRIGFPAPRCPSRVETYSAYTMCTATCGSGWRTAGTTTTKARQPMARHGHPGIAVAVFFAAGPGRLSGDPPLRAPRRAHPGRPGELRWLPGGQNVNSLIFTSLPWRPAASLGTRCRLGSCHGNLHPAPTHMSDSIASQAVGCVASKTRRQKVSEHGLRSMPRFLRKAISFAFGVPCELEPVPSYGLWTGELVTVLIKTTLAVTVIGAAAFMTPVSSAPLAPPSLPVEGPVEGLAQRLQHHPRLHLRHHHRPSSWPSSVAVITTIMAITNMATTIVVITTTMVYSLAPHLLYGVPFTYGSYDNATECHWLRRRALDTGSSDWWDRYYACLYVYGYN